MLDISLILVYNINTNLILEESIVAVSYNKLWKLLIDKNMNKTQLRVAASISTNAIAKLGRNEAVSIETLGKICQVLKCDVGDIVEFDYSTQEETDK